MVFLGSYLVSDSMNLAETDGVCSLDVYTSTQLGVSQASSQGPSQKSGNFFSFFFFLTKA